MVTCLGIWCYLYLEIPPIPTSLTFQVQLKQCWASSEYGVTYTWKYLQSPPPSLFKFSSSSVGKESACNAGDPGSITHLGRSAGEGIGYPLLDCCLENSTDWYSPWVYKESAAADWLSRSSKATFFQKSFPTTPLQSVILICSTFLMHTDIFLKNIHYAI